MSERDWTAAEIEMSCRNFLREEQTWEAFERWQKANSYLIEERERERQRKWEEQEKLARVRAAAAELVRAKQEEERKQQEIKRILACTVKVVARLTADPRLAERERRSRIKWADLIEDESVVKQQMWWERRQNVYAMKRAGLSNVEISKRMGLSRGRVAQLMELAERQCGKPSPAEKYLAKQQSFEVGKYSTHTLRRMSPLLEPFMYQINRDWLLVAGG